jgi:hypothetical protein
VVGFGQRVLAVGMNGSGKSELARYLFAQFRCRKALVDPKGDWKIAGVPRLTLQARDEAGARAELERHLDPAAPVLHVRPAWLGRPGSREQLTALYDFLDGLPGPLHVWTDEGYAVSNASWAPPGFLELQVGSRARGHGHTITSQRPRNIAVEARTEADHLFIFPPLDAEDLKETLRGSPFLTPAKALELAAGLPEYGYLWVDRRDRSTSIGDPIPDYLRADADRQLHRVSYVR